MNKRSLIYIYLPMLYALLMLGCRLHQPLVLPQPGKLPDTFNNSSDTTGIGSVPWQQFFKDPYLRDLIDSALRHNYELQSAGERVKISGAVLMAAKHAWLPAASINASAGVEKYGDYTLNGVGNFDTNLSPNINKDQRIPDPTPDLFLGLRSSWEIDMWGKLKDRKKAALMHFLASAEGKRLVTTLLVAEVASHYYELIALDSELVVLQKNIDLQESALATVSIQMEAGRATLLAQQQFQAQLLDTRSRQYTTRQRLLQVETRLNYLLGRFPQPVPRGKQLTVDTLSAAWKPGVPSQLLVNRPDIRQAELELGAAKADISAARKAFLPSLNITPYAGYNAFKAGLLLNPGSFAYGVLGSITAPLFNQKQLSAQYQMTHANTKIAWNNYQQQILRAYQEVAVALGNIDNQQQVYKLKSAEVGVLQNAVATANDLFLAGYASYLEIITAQKSVLEAELSLIQARKEMLAGTVQLYQALGGGWK
ncbi:TolC family protein [uncultured Chitinophaga sp.]|jgi:efflux transporter, outer membrane factor (OMF) lipoprotein, NodT family|uniref:TolC family protein n=1 Tax=uncultured Chitinophaga sp. TaxID=339340 RepID=UPI00262123C5|nr:TolC family protein [uncultured Chitinophaga sp.]